MWDISHLFVYVHTVSQSVYWGNILSLFILLILLCWVQLVFLGTEQRLPGCCDRLLR